MGNYRAKRLRNSKLLKSKILFLTLVIFKSLPISCACFVGKSSNWIQKSKIPKEKTNLIGLALDAMVFNTIILEKIIRLYK